MKNYRKALKHYNSDKKLKYLRSEKVRAFNQSKESKKK